jgi:hypothetical protein
LFARQSGARPEGSLQRPHDTHVSELLHRGESVVDVARRIGDRPDVILKTYAKFIPGNGTRIANRLEELYG